MDHLQRSLRNTFAIGPIDRAADRRRDPAWLAAQERDEHSQFIPVWRSQNLFPISDAPRPVLLSPHQVRAHIPESTSSTLLGILECRPYFAIDLPSGDAAAARLAELGKFQDLRQLAALLDRETGALLAYARAMAYWHAQHRFCGLCGSPTFSTEGGHARVCCNDRCGEHHFPRTDPAVIVLVCCGEQALLGRKSVWPEGQYSTVAGFVEPGESIEAAVAREVWEETGIQIAGMDYRSSQPWPFPSSLMLAFRARAARRAIRVDQYELEHARWFTRDELRDGLTAGTLRLPPPVSVSFRLIEDWFDEGSLGALHDAPNTRSGSAGA
jgi:NAD+ diphosphatase